MLKTTNPSIIKQEFMSTLSKTNKVSPQIENLLKYFCEISWWLENERHECFGKLKNFMADLPQNLKTEFIPKLIENSKNYPYLVLLAEELFQSLDVKLQESIKIPMIYWTFDDVYTSISENEYRYRMAYGKQVWVEGSDYRRPSKSIDFICYQKVLEMIIKSKSETLIFSAG